MRDKQNKLTKQTKKRFEFSKFLVIFAVIIFASYGIYSGMRYYSLIQLAIESEHGITVIPDSSLAVACVGGILGSILTYVLYQGSLKWSLNSNNLQIDQATGIIRKIADGDTKGLIEDVVGTNCEEKQNDDIKDRKCNKDKHTEIEVAG